MKTFGNRNKDRSLAYQDPLYLKMFGPRYFYERASISTL